MTQPNKPYDAKPLPLFLGLFNCLYLTQFFTDFGKILDSKSYDHDDPCAQEHIIAKIMYC